MWVNKHKPDAMELVMCLSSALKGEATSWFISAKPTEKDWPTLRAEFLAVFAKPVDSIEQFSEAVNGRRNVPGDTPLVDEMLHSMRTILSLLKNRESDEAFAVLVACYFGSTRDSVVRRRYQAEHPTDAKSMCTMLQGRLGKRAALSPSGHHTESKRRALPPSSNKLNHEKRVHFPGKCHLCGRIGHRARHCRSRHDSPTTSTARNKQADVNSPTCYTCGKSGHISPNCPSRSKREQVAERHVNICEKETVFGELKLKSGETFPFLFDTGSDCSLMKENISRYFDGKRFNNMTSLIGIGRGSSICNSQILTVVEIQDIFIEILFYVVPDDFMSADIIIGRDLIAQNINVQLSSTGLLLSRELQVQFCHKETTAFDKIETDLTGLERQNLLKLLSENQENFVVGVPSGRVTTGTLEIRLKDPNKFVQRRPYRLATTEREVVRDQISALLKANIIQPSCSPFSSPAILVKKKDGSDRLCIDFRELNANTVPDKYPLPLISDQINRLHGAYYFTTLDMASGFHQIPIHSESIEKTAFITPDGQFEFLTMPFGLTNAPAVYQRAMDAALGELRHTIALVYIDDILIPSSTIGEGLERLRVVIKALVDAGFSFNLKKCSFLKLEAEYLGFFVRAGEVRPNPRKISALMHSPIPKTPTQVRQFLGLASYFRQFIRNFSVVAAPLYQLTTSCDKKIKWLPKHDDARNTLIKFMTSEPVLMIFDPDLPVELHTDASSDGYGAVLFQKKDSKLHPIEYYSKRTTKPESAYHSYELETLAVVNAVKHFRHFLVGRRFTVITDCNSLKAARTKHDLTPRAQRWWAFLQAFDFDILYREGKRMKHADFFSRNPPLNTEAAPLKKDHKNIQIVDLRADWLAVAQQRDDEVLKIIAALKANELDPDLAKTYDIRANTLFRRIQRGHRTRFLPVVPQSMTWSVINHVHTNLKHLGWEKTLDKLYDLYWFPKMSRTVRKFVDNCLICKSSKNHSGKSQIQMHPIPKVSRPWHTVHIDISGKLTGKSDLKEYVFVVIDAFSKFIWLQRITSLTAGSAIRCIKEFVYLFGAPYRIISDQGKCFTSSEFRTFCSNSQIDLHFIAHCASRANGQVERQMETLKAILTAIEIESEQNWQDSLGEVQLALNSTTHRVTGFSPAEILFGTSIRSLDLQKIRHILAEEEEENLPLSEIRRIAAENILKTSQSDTLRKNVGKATIKPFRVGDFVFNKSNERMISKLDPKFRGPFKIVKVLENDRYEAVRLTDKGKGRTFKFAHDHLIRVPEGQGKVPLESDTTLLPAVSAGTNDNEH
jgi:transposase InsO family protein